jgi:hypothetical protein
VGDKLDRVTGLFILLRVFTVSRPGATRCRDKVTALVGGEIEQRNGIDDVRLD